MQVIGQAPQEECRERHQARVQLLDTFKTAWTALSTSLNDGQHAQVQVTTVHMWNLPSMGLLVPVAVSQLQISVRTALNFLVCNKNLQMQYQIMIVSTGTSAD